MQAHAIYRTDVSPDDYSRPISPLGSSSIDTELQSVRASAQAAGRGSCSVPNTPSRANLTASFNAVQQPDEGPTLNIPAGSPKQGGARPMLPEDSTDWAGVSPARNHGAPQQGDSPPQGDSATRASASPVGANAGSAKGRDSGSSRGSGVSKRSGGSPVGVEGRDSSSKGSSKKGSEYPSDVHATPARFRGSNSKGSNSKGSGKDDGNQGSSNNGSISSKASGSRDDSSSRDNIGTAPRGTVLSYKDKLLSEAAQAAASSSAASNRNSPASSVSSAHSSAGQDQNGRSSVHGSKGGVSNSVSSDDGTPQHGVTALHGGTPQHEATPQHGGGRYHGAELNTFMFHQADSSPEDSSRHQSNKVLNSAEIASMSWLTHPSMLMSSCMQACEVTLCTACCNFVLHVDIL